ncbi:hypothetical protein SASPL_108004 [Salvia splendens]|uniref:Auxin efflux carrier family n=1 Tax=Salvia splendens TaxID=180675 RepID=A0A8X9A4Z3_SALSN|nr:hypothetical protein SASPL_108004 [Salvia splendens]
MFKPDQCDAINRFNCYFIIPFFIFQFTSGVDPYAMNFRFLAEDVVAKAIAAIALALWAKFAKKSSFAWVITSFNLSSFNNTLVVGVPLLKGSGFKFEIGVDHSRADGEGGSEERRRNSVMGWRISAFGNEMEPKDHLRFCFYC